MITKSPKTPRIRLAMEENIISAIRFSKSKNSAKTRDLQMTNELGIHNVITLIILAGHD